MTELVHSLLLEAGQRWPERTAIRYLGHDWTYRRLADEAVALAKQLRGSGLAPSDRVAIYAEKRHQVVASIYGASIAGGVFVPINPLLKAEQVEYILRDCAAHTLITTEGRLAQLLDQVGSLPALRRIIVMARQCKRTEVGGVACAAWAGAETAAVCIFEDPPPRIDADVAAILYTSGSTGQPKGVVLSHRNIVAGASSVAQYLDLGGDDRLLAVLPLSFDYGLNQITTATLAGAQVVLLNHLFPQDVIAEVVRERITGLAGVPPLWIQLADLPWPEEVRNHLRYITNSGGHMPRLALRALQNRLPTTRPFLMYGLTEAFRSTYLPPEEIAKRPDSIGKAIPNAEILVVRPDGTSCDVDEPGELVHRGVHVALGYWNDVERTRARFKPVPRQLPELPMSEMAVWSGDTVRRDADGFLYFVARTDEMIKTSGYRVSPNEIEAAIGRIPGVSEVVAFGVPDERLGQSIAVVLRAARSITREAIVAACRQRLPSYMVPASIDLRSDELPRNANGKIDRPLLARQHGRHVAAAQLEGA